MQISTNTVAVVTEAASGIGKAVALELAKRGCRLALVDLNKKTLEENLVEFSKFHQPISLHPTDVSIKAEMEKLPAKILSEYKQIHLLINNAGVSVASPFDKLDLEDFHWLMGVNLLKNKACPFNL